MFKLKLADMKSLFSLVLSEVKTLFPALSKDFYRDMFVYIFLFSLLLFIVSSFWFPLSRDMILNYYFKDEYGAFYGFSVLFLVLIGAFFASAFSVYLFLKFNYTSNAQMVLFLIFYILFYILFYYFMLAESSFSFFVYTEFNGLFDAIVNAFTLYLTIVLSAFLFVQLKESLSSGIFGTGSGLIAALFSLGCPSCGALLWSLVGLGGLSFLPFHGFELRFISLIILVWATYESYKAVNFKDKKVDMQFSLK